MSGTQNNGTGATGTSVDGEADTGRNENKNHFEEGTLFLTCETKKSAQPVHWFKNGEQIRANTKQPNIVKDVTFDGTNTFSCDNGAVEIECSVTAKKVPIKHRVPLKIQRIEEKDTLNIDCECEIPPDSATWFFNNKDITKPPDNRLKFSSPDKVLQLKITDITEDDTGDYRCIYKGIETNIKLTVRDSQDKSGQSRDVKKTGVSFKCEIRKKDSHIVTWLKDGQKIDFGNKKFSSSDDKCKHRLIVTNCDASDAGEYSCIWWDEISKSTCTVNAKPDPPSGLKVVNVTHDNVTLKWNAGLDGRLAQRFKVGYKPAKGGRNKCVYGDVKPSDRTEFTVTGLATGTEYQFSVTAKNDLGESLPSDPVTARTPAKPDPPSDLKVVNVTHDSVTLKWNAGFDESLQQQFKVGYKPAEGSTHKFVYVDVKPSDSTQFTVTGLEDGTEYQFSVTAKNDLGESSPSSSVTARTPAKPGQPTDLQLVEFSSNSVSLIWKARGDGDLPQMFTVSYKPTTGSQIWRKMEVQPPSSTEFTVDGIAPRTEYEFFVTAYNDSGESPPSSTITAKTSTTPDQPDDLQLINVSNNSVSLKWKAGNDGGLPQRFRVSYKSKSDPQKSSEMEVKPQDGTEFTVDVLGLEPGTEYSFFVAAYNDIGKSEDSNTITAKTSSILSTLMKWTKSPVFLIGCSVLLSLVLNNIIRGDTRQLPLQNKELSSLEQRLDETDVAVLNMKRKFLEDRTTLTEMIETYKSELNQTDENKLKDIVERIDKTANDLLLKAGEQELEDAKTGLENKLKEMEINSKTLMDKMQKSVNVRLAEVTDFIETFKKQFVENQESLKVLEKETDDKTVSIKASLDILSSKVERVVPGMIQEVTDQLNLIKKAKSEADEIVQDIQNDVDRIIPNTFNKEALIMAFMVMIIFVFMLALWIYKVQNSLAAGDPVENMNAKDVLQRIPLRVKLHNSICIVSFDEARKDAHEALVRSAFTMDNVETVYFVVRRHEHLLKLPRCKFYIMCTEFSERHVIIEEPGLGLGDLKRCTYQAIQRFGAKMMILYTRDPGSRNLGDKLYNHKIHCVSSQPELSGLRDQGRFFSTYDELSDTQKRTLNETIVKCIQ